MSGKTVRARELLRGCRVEVAPEIFTLLSFKHTEFARVLDIAGISPRGASPFLIFADRHEVTLMLAENDLQSMRHAIGEAKMEGGFSLLTLDIELDLDVVGFMAEISAVLAKADVPIFPISAFSRDHLLIKQNDLASALAALGSVVEDLC